MPSSCRPVRRAISAADIPCALELKDFAVSRLAQGQDAFPQLIGLNDLAGPGLRRGDGDVSGPCRRSVPRAGAPFGGDARGREDGGAWR